MTRITDSNPPGGWYADPEHAGQQRYWTGERWGEERRDVETPAVYAAFWRRAVAIIVDVVIFATVVSALTALGGAVAGDTGRGIVALAGAIGLPLYFGLAEWAYGHTLGKAWLGIRVVSADGGELSLEKAIGRQVARVISNVLFGLGWWWAAWDREHATWHDKIAGTRVVAAEPHRRDVDDLAAAERADEASPTARAETTAWTPPGATGLHEPEEASAPSREAAPPTFAAAAAPATMQSPELTADAGRSGSRRRVVAVVAAVFLVVVVAGDWLVRNIEMDRIVTATGETEEVMELWIADRTAMFAEFERLQSPTQTRIDAWVTQFERTAAWRYGQLRDHEAELADVNALPWHRSVATAKSRMLDHTAAWGAALRAIGEDAVAYDDPVAGAEISSTFRIAERAYRDAVPTLPLFDLRARVDDIFDE